MTLQVFQVKIYLQNAHFNVHLGVSGGVSDEQ